MWLNLLPNTHLRKRQKLLNQNKIADLKPAGKKQEQNFTLVGCISRIVLLNHQRACTAKKIPKPFLYFLITNLNLILF